jgi:hypothetical protein
MDSRMRNGIIGAVVTLCVAFAVSAGVMWVFGVWMGCSPVIVAGFLGVGYACNGYFKPPNKR